MDVLERLLLGLALTVTLGCPTEGGPVARVEPSPKEAAPVCPSFGPGRSSGTLQSSELLEVSGLAASRSQQDVLWVHNDSGDRPRLFALNTAGVVIAEVQLEGATAYDWEDLAIGPGTKVGTEDLYVGDIGDNARVRRYVTLYRVPEPSVEHDRPDPITLDTFTTLELVYPDGPHNAETLMVDPIGGDIFIITKDMSGSRIYRTPAPVTTEDTLPLQEVGSLAFGQGPLLGSPLATAGDVSPDGGFVAVRTYSGAFVWRRAPNTPLHEAFLGKPCPLPTRPEEQGEALAFTPDSDGYVTISEGFGADVWRFDALALIDRPD